MDSNSEKHGKWFETHIGLLAIGVLIGIGAIVLQALGNPPNMGLCVGCFMRDIAGAIGLHRADIAQYVRPEVIGILIGAMLAAGFSREWRSRGSAAASANFLLGVFAMVGVLVFLGCPWRALLRTGAGDLNGLIGIAGFAVGIAIAGMWSGHRCVSKQEAGASWFVGMAFPAVMVLFLVLSVLKVKFAPGLAMFSSESGPGSMHAPGRVSLAVGLFVGILVQRSRFCLVGALRSALFERNFRLLSGLIGVLMAVVVGNLLIGKFRIGLHGMPLAHTNYVWSFAAMILCGLAFATADGCPLRQIVRSAEGSSDAALFCVGMLVGAGICHNWSLISTPDKVVNGICTVGGPTVPAMIAVAVGIVFCVFVGVSSRDRV